MYFSAHLSVISLILAEISSLQVDVYPQKTRCIGQELDQEDLATFFYRAFQLRTDSQINGYRVEIIDPEGNILNTEEATVGQIKGDFSEYVANIRDRGVHKLCFSLSSGETPIRVVFEITFKNRTNDPSKKIEKNELPTLESRLQRAEELLVEVSKEIDFAKRQEALLRLTGESTNSRIQWFSILSILILLTASLWQILYLRHFFASKKLL